VTIRAVRAAYGYEGALRSALHRVKYRGERRRGELLAMELAAVAPALLAPWRDELASVVPVPLHPSRLRERGFNQSALLASAAARVLGLPVRENLVRVRPTPAQVGQRRHERFRNVAGAFRWTGEPLSGTVLLVDDVVTTGATISAAADALATGGARSVVVLALARAPVD
jgi:ComF family protein